MFRNTCWRRNVNDLVSWHQDQALNTTIFILREFGPTGFLLKEEGETKNFKRGKRDDKCIVQVHPKYAKLDCDPGIVVAMEDDSSVCHAPHCSHTIQDCFQLGLVEREINQLLWGLHRVQTPRPAANISESKQKTTEDDGCVGQKMIDAEDVCPICQEELLKKKLPVSYCRYGCGNNVHISCMKIWADHQTKSEFDTMVKCPLCRENFASLKLLYEEVKNSAKLTTAAEKERPDRHLGIPCNSCRVFTINGKCFKLASGYQESPPEVSLRQQKCYSSIQTENVSKWSAVSADTSVRIINRAYNEKHAPVEGTRNSAVRGRPKRGLGGSAVCPASPENVFVGLNVLSKDCMVQGRDVGHPGRATSHKRVNYRRPRYNSVKAAVTDETLTMEGIHLHTK
ncbi:UNVERIFIED_CONTAM: hypothetical protein FKN15_028174 [Acipenser sinensis]